ncbi:hypothetical protein DPMN_044604 [Dreissena polymorpha]|uniref:Uncharacterized protein n=1 Tax=Dreissena polymorpha TaxID=45954 RepID=A0A9D4D2K3_DREPO|nr:hypothetical protein DPMN_044604 [Dreissena polymorpha]
MQTELDKIQIAFTLNCLPFLQLLVSVSQIDVNRTYQLLVSVSQIDVNLTYQLLVSVSQIDVNLTYQLLVSVSQIDVNLTYHVSTYLLVRTFIPKTLPQ